MIASKNDPQSAVIIFHKSPKEYPTGMFPINVTIHQVNETAVGKSWVYLMHAYTLVLYRFPYFGTKPILVFQMQHINVNYNKHTVANVSQILSNCKHYLLKG